MDVSVEGNAYINGAFHHCCIGITQGKICAIKKILHADTHLNFGSKLILPAGIDIHAHFRDPGFTRKEDFFTGSQAAAHGGITTVFDMPNTKPATNTTDSLTKKIQTAGKKSVVDFGIYAGVTDSNINRISQLAKYCSGFKIYLGSTTTAEQLSISNLSHALSILSKTKKLTFVHAEDASCLKKHETVEHSLNDHLRTHPAQCEETAIQHLLRIAKTVPIFLHICHLSSCEGVQLIRKRPTTVSVGMTPHHLLFELEKLPTNSTWYKVNPPIRTRLDRETLWHSMITGNLDVIESDHAPHTIEEKQSDFAQAPSGVPGVETLYPIFLALVQQNRLTFQRLIRLVSEKPAELMHLPKGKIEVGRDADLLVVDMRNILPITADALHSKSGWTPFEGWPAIFPNTVFLRGEKLIADHELQVKQGFGTFVEASHA